MLRIRSVFPCSYKNPENRHRSRRGRPRPEFRKPPKKNGVAHYIGPGFIIPRYKRANYPDELLLQNPDTAPPKRPIYDNFHYPTKPVPNWPKPGNWTAILREIDRLWKLSRSYHLEQIRKRAEKSRAISEQDLTKHDDETSLPDFEVSAHGQAPRKTRSCPVSPLRTTKKVYRNTKPWIP
ncbi:uncharacterized protein LOC144882408 isoform X2 [Branchiostoma floridae x Branchiostoma japonicum]